jgi:hypothetical protein
MLADPSHIKKFSNDDAIAIRRTFFLRKGKHWKLKKPRSRVGAVIKTFVEIGVRIGRTGTEGRFFRKG